MFVERTLRSLYIGALAVLKRLRITVTGDRSEWKPAYG